MKNNSKQAPKSTNIMEFGKDEFIIGRYKIITYVPYENNGITNRNRISKPYLVGFSVNNIQVLN